MASSSTDIPPRYFLLLRGITGVGKSHLVQELKKSMPAGSVVQCNNDLYYEDKKKKGTPVQWTFDTNKRYAVPHCNKLMEGALKDPRVKVIVSDNWNMCGPCCSTAYGRKPSAQQIDLHWRRCVHDSEFIPIVVEFEIPNMATARQCVRRNQREGDAEYLEEKARNFNRMVDLPSDWEEEIQEEHYLSVDAPNVGSDLKNKLLELMGFFRSGKSYLVTDSKKC